MLPAGEVPDTPEDFELRAMLRLPKTELVSAGTGFLALNPTIEVGLLRGVVDPAIARSVADRLEDRWLLIADEAPPDLGPRWTWEPASTLVLDDPKKAAKTASRAKGLRQVTPEELVRIYVPSTIPQILAAFEHGPVMGAFTESGGLAAVAYSILGSERHFHPTVRAMPPYKGNGFGRRVIQAAAGLFELERERGRTPVPTIRDQKTIILGAAWIVGFKVLRRRWFA